MRGFILGAILVVSATIVKAEEPRPLPFPTQAKKLAMSEPPAIVVHFEAFQLDTDKLKQLGLDDGDEHFVAMTAHEDDTSSPLKVLKAGSDGALQANIKRWQSAGVLKKLIAPIMITTSGKQAYCFVGKEIPILVPQSLGTVSIQYRPVGTTAQFEPVLKSDGSMRMTMFFDHSEELQDRSVAIEGVRVPSLRCVSFNQGFDAQPKQVVAFRGFSSTRLVPMTKIGRRGRSVTTNERHSTELLLVCRADVVPEGVELVNAVEELKSISADDPVPAKDSQSCRSRCRINRRLFGR